MQVDWEKMLLRNFPVVNAAGGGGEVDADLEEPAAVTSERPCIAFRFNLPQSLLRALVHFQLQDIDILRSLHQDVHAAVGGVTLHLHVEAHQAEEHVERVLEVNLQISHHLIITVGEEVLQAAHEALGITFFHVFHKSGNGKCILLLHFRSVERIEILDEALFHLTVWKPQPILIEAAVIALQRKVAALVEQRQRVLVHDIDAVERVGGEFLLGHAGQRIAGLLQLIDQERRGARLEPVVAELLAGQCVEHAERIVHARAVHTEVVAVEVALHSRVALFLGHLIVLGQQRHAFVEVGVQLLLRDAADSGVALVEGDVEEVVHVAEHARLAELGHTRQEGEADVAVA